jgi:hypothetical protein
MRRKTLTVGDRRAASDIGGDLLGDERVPASGWTWAGLTSNTKKALAMVTVARPHRSYTWISPLTVSSRNLTPPVAPRRDVTSRVRATPPGGDVPRRQWCRHRGLDRPPCRRRTPNPASRSSMRGLELSHIVVRPGPPGNRQSPVADLFTPTSFAPGWFRDWVKRCPSNSAQLQTVFMLARCFPAGYSTPL